MKNRIIKYHSPKTRPGLCNVSWFKTLLILGLVFIFALCIPGQGYLFAQEPGDTLWTRTYGGSENDYGNSVRQTTDGGYIITGTTKSFCAGESDVWLIKTDVAGDTLWTKTFGGTERESSDDVQQTADGGYIITGQIRYSDGDADVWLIKTDSSGDTLWTKAFGGTEWEFGHSVDTTSDGGYIIAGRTSSFGAGSNDVYLVKTDVNGDTLWTRTYGGTDNDYGNSVQQTTDGGYIISGATKSFGATEGDVWLIKTDVTGDTLWTKTFGGTDCESSNDVKQTTDGGYIIGGYTWSFGSGEGDVYLIKTDSNGDVLWTKTYGGTAYDCCESVQQTIDNGYIITGCTYSSNPYCDAWLLKTNPSGDTLWTKTFNGTEDDSYDLAKSVQQTMDGGYIITGITGFAVLPDTCDADIWLIKIAEDTDPGTISGIVALNGGTGNVDDVLITTDPGTYQTNPISGNYSLVVPEGDYSITATLESYIPQTFENVHVDHGQTTIVDLVLNPVDVVVTPSDFYFTTDGATSDVLNLENQNDIGLDYQISINLESEVELHYDGTNNGTLGPGPPELTWAVRFTSDELSGYYDNGYKITHIKCFFYQLPGENTEFKVWEGGSFGDPGTEVYSATGSGFISGDWMIHELSSPIPLVSGNEYWVGCIMNNIPEGNSPCGVDAGPMVSGKGGWLYMMGAWYQLTDLGPDFNWNMRAIISKPWLACAPISGTIPANGNTQVDVMIDATELSDGDYFADVIVKILPELATYTVPVHLHRYPGYAYLPGDCNMALGLWPPSVIGGDVSYLVGYFIGEGNAACKLDDFWASADVTGDCSIIGGDVSALVGYFIGTVPAISWCGDDPEDPMSYPPAWLEGVPDDAPVNWPNCDAPVINNTNVIPTGTIK